MAYQDIIYEKDPPVGRIILNRPEKMNALSYRKLNEIAEAAKEMERDDDIMVLIIKGAGRCFSSGYDLTPPEPDKTSALHPPGGVYISADRDNLWMEYNRHHMRVYLTLWDLQKPVIAQIHSYCLAGATELASFCDMRFLADDVQIGWPVGRALSPGNIQWESWIMGITKAKEFLFTGDPMDAQEAYRVHWATRVYAREQLEEETENFARRIALIPTDLIMFTKRSVNRQYEVMGMKVGLDWGSDILALQGYRKSADEFMKMVQEKGLKAALDWRDSRFKDYRTAKEAGEKRQG